MTIIAAAAVAAVTAALAVAKGNKMKITTRQLRSLIREAIAGENERIAGAASAAISPEAWAAKNGLTVDTDNDGQKIIALTPEEADVLSLPPGVGWDPQQDSDGWTIYTNEYVEQE